MTAERDAKSSDFVTQRRTSDIYPGNIGEGFGGLEGTKQNGVVFSGFKDRPLWENYILMRRTKNINFKR